MHRRHTARCTTTTPLNYQGYRSWPKRSPQPFNLAPLRTSRVQKWQTAVRAGARANSLQKNSDADVTPRLKGPVPRDGGGELLQRDLQKASVGNLVEQR